MIYIFIISDANMITYHNPPESAFMWSTEDSLVQVQTVLVYLDLFCCCASKYGYYVFISY